MSSGQYALDWGDLAFSSKRPLSNLKATFIATPRELSARRFKQLVKQFLPMGNIILGLAKENYVDGFAGQPHFRTLCHEAVAPIINKVNDSATPHKIYTLSYLQRELKHILDQAAFREVLLINGSWKYAFHNLEPYYVLANKRIPYQMLSPFTDEIEARTYQNNIIPEMRKAFWPNEPQGLYTAEAMLELAAKAAAFSFDYSFQTGVVLARPVKNGYQYITHAYNSIVPFETFALHNGAAREIHFSPPGDLNHYDTVHAETELVIQAQKQQLDLHGTTLFINLLPCPACCRMLCETDIEEFVYSEDHSAGYAVRMFELAGKRVRRLVTKL